MTAPPGSLPLAEPYFDAWNARDLQSVAGAFAEGGTYIDPVVTGLSLTGRAITGRARALFTASPDLSLEILGRHPADRGQVMAQWLLHGTTTGMWNGQPPARPAGRHAGRGVFSLTVGQIGRGALRPPGNGRAARLPDSAAVRGGRPVPVRLCRPGLGWQRQIPGAFGLTWIDARPEQEAEEIKLTAAVVAVELAREPGVSAGGIGPLACRSVRGSSPAIFRW